MRSVSFSEESTNAGVGVVEREPCKDDSVSASQLSPRSAPNGTHGLIVVILPSHRRNDEATGTALQPILVTGRALLPARDRVHRSRLMNRAEVVAVARQAHRPAY